MPRPIPLSLPARPVAGLVLLSFSFALALGLGGCKRAASPAPASRPAASRAASQAPAAPARTRDQAIAALLALPEIKAWSEQIEQRSHGSAHGAVIEDDPTPRMVDGKPYYQLSFVENHPKNVHRRAIFLVARQGQDILVEDAETDTLQSLSEWRRNIRMLTLGSK
jgi:hypothetical protein